MTAIDEGLLSPVSASHDELVSDRAFLRALVGAEAALLGAYADIGIAPAEVVRALDDVGDLDVGEIAAAAAGGGNPVIPLVPQLKDAAPDDVRAWIHRGATSQDIWDTAIMSVAQRAVSTARASLRDTADALRGMAATHRDDLAVARTLTQHAVPTTIGARAATWVRGLDRVVARLDELVFPAQLGGAGGTLASFVEITGSPEAARELVVAFSRRSQLSAPDAPWHVTRWPVTELGDALVQAMDAVGKFATDVATLSRTEIGELAEGTGGGSSAMPQKQNPAHSVLIRSAALRAPQLAATLHLAAALAGDERPDGAWHAEWPTLRELLRLALGATWHASSLAAHLRVDTAAATRNLQLTGGLVLSERLSLVLTPLIGKDAVTKLVGEAAAGGDLAALVQALPEASGLDVDALLDPAEYTGRAGSLVDQIQEEE
jgi:3-carboxy-cis,cis-muconate cycloisomerase